MYFSETNPHLAVVPRTILQLQSDDWWGSCTIKLSSFTRQLKLYKRSRQHTKWLREVKIFRWINSQRIKTISDEKGNTEATRGILDKIGTMTRQYWTERVFYFPNTRGPERSPQHNPKQCSIWTWTILYFENVGESVKRSTVVHEEGTNYTNEHIRTRLDWPSQGPSRRGQDTSEGRVKFWIQFKEAAYI